MKTIIWSIFKEFKYIEKETKMIRYITDYLKLFPRWYYYLVFTFGGGIKSSTPATLFLMGEMPNTWKLARILSTLSSFKKSEYIYICIYIAFAIFFWRQFFNKNTVFFVFSLNYCMFLYSLYYLLSRLTQITFCSWYNMRQVTSKVNSNVK